MNNIIEKISKDKTNSRDMKNKKKISRIYKEGEINNKTSTPTHPK